MNQATPDDTTTLGVVRDLKNISPEEIRALADRVGGFLLEVNRLNDIAKLMADDPHDARRRLWAQRGPYQGMEALWFALATALVFECRSSVEHDERSVQDEFFGSLDRYLPGAVRAIVPHVPGFVPDGFVRIDGEVAPVEVKRRRFTGLGLRQILSYMEAHGTRRGIAVAPELGCELPPGITFVAVSAGETL